MRLVHTADIHLDASYVSLRLGAEFGNSRRQGLREVFHAVVSRAAAWPADALLIAGDLFDLERVTRDTVAFLQAEFDAVRPLPIVIAPGARDPYVASSPYATAPWPNNVFIFDAPEWKSRTLADGDLTVHGFGYDGPMPSVNPFGELRVAYDKSRVQVAVAHGAEERFVVPGQTPCACFSAATLALRGLSYVALGHVHAMIALEGGFETPMYYSGAPEGHGFDEPGPRHYLEIEIDDGGVRVNPKSASRVVYARHAIDCSRYNTIEQVVESVRNLGAASELPQVAEVTLTGVHALDLHLNVSTIQDAAASGFEALQLINRAEAADDFEELGRENTCLGVFIRRMNDEMRDAPDTDRYDFVRRARELGLTAYRQHQQAICELDEDSP